MYADFGAALTPAFVPWNGTRLDTALYPFALPASDTVDGYIAAHWNASLHAYAGIFVESLDHAPLRASAPVATTPPPTATPALRDAVQSADPADFAAVADGVGFSGVARRGGEDGVRVGVGNPNPVAQSGLTGRWIEFTVMVNQTAKHAVPYALSAANNGMLRALLSEQAGDGSPVATQGMHVTLQPFPTVPSERRVRPPTPPVTRETHP